MALGSFLDKAKKAAEQAAQQAQDVATKAQDAASKVADQTAKATADARKNLADRASQWQDKAAEAWNNIDADMMVADIKASVDSLGAASSQAFGKTNEVARKFLNRTAETIDCLIRRMVRGLNLQETIDSINKVGAEKKVDVAPLVDFIQRLKEFGDEKE